jgi:hypothetical protein
LVFVRTLIAQSDGETLSLASDAVERSVPKAKEESSAAASTSSAESAVVVAADASAGGKKGSGKKARVQPAE